MAANLLVPMLLCMCTVCSLTAGALRIDAPCSACRAVATELQARINEEKARNHLDMRHRLDSSGQRYGKVIEYKVSELRAVELLEGLCSVMNKWTLVTVNSTEGKTSHWELSSEAAPRSRLPSLEEDVRHKQLTNYCGRVLEEHDEDITSAIQAGKLEGGGVADWLCTGLVKSCPVKPSAAVGKKSKGTVIETSDGTTSKQSEAAAQAAAAAEAAAAQAAAAAEAAAAQAAAAAEAAAAASAPSPASGQEGSAADATDAIASKPEL